MRYDRAPFRPLSCPGCGKELHLATCGCSNPECAVRRLENNSHRACLACGFVVVVLPGGSIRPLSLAEIDTLPTETLLEMGAFERIRQRVIERIEEEQRSRPLFTRMMLG